MRDLLSNLNNIEAGKPVEKNVAAPTDDTKAFKSLLESFDSIEEAPSKRDIVSRDVVRKAKTKPDSEIKNVTYQVQGETSATITRLANRANKAMRIAKEMNKIAIRAKDEVRDTAEAISQAGDEIYTRIFETASLAAQIAKKGSDQVTVFDQDAYIEKLEQMSGLAEDKLEALRGSLTDTETLPADRITKPAVTFPASHPKNRKKVEKKAKKESVNENKGSRIRTFVANWLSSYDKALSRIKQQAGV